MLEGCFHTVLTATKFSFSQLVHAQLPGWHPAWSGQLQPPPPGLWDMLSLPHGAEAQGSSWEAWEKGKVRVVSGGAGVGTASAGRVEVTATEKHRD